MNQLTGAIPASLGSLSLLGMLCVPLHQLLSVGADAT
jgi:hypothetical protein